VREKKSAHGLIKLEEKKENFTISKLKIVYILLDIFNDN